MLRVLCGSRFPWRKDVGSTFVREIVLTDLPDNGRCDFPKKNGVVHGVTVNIPALVTEPPGVVTRIFPDTAPAGTLNVS